MCSPRPASKGKGRDKIGLTLRERGKKGDTEKGERKDGRPSL